MAARNKPIKDSYFVRRTVEDGPVLFLNATAYVDKRLPYRDVQASCAVRVYADAVLFSLLHIPRKKAASLYDQPIRYPNKILNRLRADVDGAELDSTSVHVTVSYSNEESPVSARYLIERDENDVCRLTLVDGYGEGDDKDDDPTFSLSYRPVQAVLLFRSPKVNRALAISYVGYLGAPNTFETAGRAAAKVLNSLAGLAEFRILSGIETVHIPHPPASWANRAAPRSNTEHVGFLLPLYLFTDDLELIGSGELGVEVDLDTANQATGRLHYRFSPPEQLRDVFEQYRQIVDDALTESLRLELGDELQHIVLDVVLGDIGAGTAERVRDAFNTLAGNGIDATTRQYRPHDSSM